MNVELNGLQFGNKGAALMLHAILRKLRLLSDGGADLRAAMYPAGTYEERAVLGLYQVFKSDNQMIKPIEKLLRPKFKEKYGLVTPDDIDVFLDASGYAYGDKWGVHTIKSTAKYVKYLKRNKSKVIFLPQAFGPFENSEQLKYLDDIITSCDLIFARDQESYNYLTQGRESYDHIKTAPDFTNLISGVVPDYFVSDEEKEYVAVIPNSKMYSSNSKMGRDRYFEYLNNLILSFKNRREDPFILVHDTISDRRISNDLAESTGVRVIVEEDPLAIKGIISKCKLVVSSRFHGVVSALAQAVPVLATSWSHKYEMLLSDYDHADGLLGFENDDIDKVHFLLDERNNNQLRNKLREKSEIEKRKSEDMWREVLNLMSD